MGPSPPALLRARLFCGIYFVSIPSLVYYCMCVSASIDAYLLVYLFLELCSQKTSTSSSISKA